MREKKGKERKSVGNKLILVRDIVVPISQGIDPNGHTCRLQENLTDLIDLVVHDSQKIKSIRVGY